MSFWKTTLDEMKRIYRYLSGTSKGCDIWTSQLKELFPEAMTGMKPYIMYNFDGDKVWELILQNKEWCGLLEKRRIASFWELSEKLQDSNRYMYNMSPLNYRDDI